MLLALSQLPLITQKLTICGVKVGGYIVISAASTTKKENLAVFLAGASLDRISDLFYCINGTYDPYIQTSPSVQARGRGGLWIGNEGVI